MQRILEDLQVFVDMTEAINSDLDLDRVLQSVTDAGTRLSGARFGAFFYNVVEGEEDRFSLYVLSGADREHFDHLPAPRITDLFAPTFTGSETVRIADVREDPRVVNMPLDHLPLLSYLATPVISRSGQVTGALLFGHPTAGRFDQRSEDVVRMVAAQAAVAVENARLFADEQTARRSAEQAAERLTLLQAITSRLALSSTREQVVRAVIETLVGPLGASRIGVFLREGAVFRAVDGLSPDDPPPVGPRPQNPQLGVLPADGDNPVAACAAQQRPLVYETLADLAAHFPETGAAVSGIEAAVLVPLTAGDRTLGVLALAWREPRVFDAIELDWLGSASDQLSSALLRAELKASERAAQVALRDSAAYAIAVSQTLQRSLLPPALPTVEALTVAVRYVPGSLDAEVGGDWYDVIATPDGGVVLVIGDVQGHSINAAAVMGQLRVALNAYLVEGHLLHVALSRVNRVMETLRTEVLATCCLISIDPATGQAFVVRAGHTLPLLCRADGTVEEVVSDGGIPLGVLAEWEWPTTELQLRAGDRLLLYTDGLVETPGIDVSDGVDELARAVRATSSGDRARYVEPEEREARLEAEVDEVLAAMGDRTRDDVALLACEYAGPAAAYRRAQLHVSSVAEVAAARSFTRTTLGSWGLSRLEDTMALLVTEMVTNALVHTDGTATLELRRQEDVVRVMVTDPFSKVPRPRMADESATGGRGMLVVGALAMEWGVEPSGEGKTVWADVKA